jgi:3-(3-hydroxy-phenyl)propionate hydroxylase
MPEQPSGTVIQDSENTMHFWFEARGIDWVLIRPDRFVAAVGTKDDATHELDLFCRTVLPADTGNASAPSVFAAAGVNSTDAVPEAVLSRAGC